MQAIAKILATDGPSRTARLLDPAWCERKRGTGEGGVTQPRAKWAAGHYKSFSAKHENAGDRMHDDAVASGWLRSCVHFFSDMWAVQRKRAKHAMSARPV